MVTGEAAGTAAAYSINNGVTFRQMTQSPASIRRLQNQLIRQGAYLVEYEPPRKAVMNHWAYPGLVVLRELGLAAGGYANDYRLEDHISNRWALKTRFDQMMRVISERTAYRGELQVRAWEITLDRDEFTVGELFQIAAQGASLGDPEWLMANGASGTPMAFASDEDARAYLLERGVLNSKNRRHFHNTDALATNGQLMSLFGSLHDVLMKG